MEKEIVILPPHALWRSWSGQAPCDDEDRELPYRLLKRFGLNCRRIDIYPFPINPGARSHPLLQAIDPIRAFRVLLFHRRADVVLCFFEASSLILLLLRRLFGFNAKIIVVDVGSLSGWRLRRLIQDLVLPRADMVLPYSAIQSRAIARLWPAARNVRPVFAHVDCAFFSAATDRPFGPVLSVGDDGGRDYATLLGAVAGLKATVTIRTHTVVEDAAKPGNVIILPKPLPMPEYRDLIASACIIVLPLRASEYASGVSALIQAMASAKAIVVSASPGVMEYVTDGETALVVPCHDQLALRAAIERLMVDGELRTRLGQAARTRALERYSLHAWSDTLRDVIDFSLNHREKNDFSTAPATPNSAAVSIDWPAPPLSPPK